MTCVKFCWSLAVVVCTATLANAQLSINPVADAFVTEGSPSIDRSALNYGASGALGVSAPGSPQGEFQSVLRFNLASVVAGFDGSFGAGQWAISAVRLRLAATNPNSAMFNAPQVAGDFEIEWMANDAWVEGAGNPNAPSGTGVNFDNLPTFLSGADESLGVFTVTALADGDLTTFNLDLSAASGFISDVQSGGLVSLHLAADDTGIRYLFNSRTFSPPGGPAPQRLPLLTIEAVPVPEPSLALGTGLVGLLIVARSVMRRRARLAL